MLHIKRVQGSDSAQGLAAALSHLHHLSIAITFLFAVGRLFLIKGCSGAALAFFVFPPALALMVVIKDESRWNRRIAEWFLLAIDACVINGWFHFLPGAFNQFANLPRGDDRVLSGYFYVYCVYAVGIVPPYVLIRSLWRHGRGELALFSPVQCWLYLVLWAALAGVCLVGCVVAPNELLKGIKLHL